MMRTFLLSLLLLTLPVSAQIARRQADVSVTAVNYPVTITFPTAPQPHDLLFLAVSAYSGATVAPSGSGWTLLLRQSAGNWQQLVYWHAVAAGEANSYPVTNDNQSQMTMMDIQGTAFYSPIDLYAILAPASATASYTTPAVTGSVTGELPIAVVSSDDVTGVSVASPWTGAFSAQPHPLSLATGPLTTDTTTPQSATFTFSAASTKGFGAATILVKPYNATPIAPVASSGSGYSGILPNLIQFDASASSDPKQEALTYAWTFGDGANGTGVSPAHSYAALGSYTATVTATNTDGMTNSASTTVVIQCSPTNMTLGVNGALGCFSPSPADAWHQRVDGAAVDPNSAALIAVEGKSGLHVDGGSGKYGAYGIPYVVVDDSPTAILAPFVCNPASTECYLAYSDVTLFPFPVNPPIEGTPAQCESGVYGDNHLILVGRSTGRVYELWQARNCPGEATPWSANAAAVWDGTISNQQRPYTFTSADAGGLSVFSGLVRYDEVQAVLASPACKANTDNCYLPHAMRMEFAKQQCHSTARGQNGAWYLPAVHSTCNAGDLSSNPNQIGNRYGDRWRLMASYDISGFSPIAQVILRTAKLFGWFNADIGSDFYFQTTADTRWNDDADLVPINSISRSNLELVARPATYYAQDLYPTGPPPVINSFTATPATITVGQCATLAWNVSGVANGGYVYIDNVGMLSAGTGSQSYCPTATKTLVMTAQNRFLAGDDGYGDGHRPTANATVTVHPPTPIPFASGNVIVGAGRQ